MNRSRQIHAMNTPSAISATRGLCNSAMCMSPSLCKNSVEIEGDFVTRAGFKTSLLRYIIPSAMVSPYANLFSALLCPPPLRSALLSSPLSCSPTLNHILILLPIKRPLILQPPSVIANTGNLFAVVVRDRVIVG